MKKKTIIMLCVTVILSAGIAKAYDRTGNGSPRAKKLYSMNIIGVKNPLTSEMDDTNAHVIFVLLNGTSKINLREGRTFRVLDKNGTDKDGATLQLPNPGFDPYLVAMKTFVEIQDSRSDSNTWSQFSEMLESSNPLMIETALQQFIRFRRGDTDLSLSVRPLLDHPNSIIRQYSAELIGLIVAIHGAADLPEEASLRAELFSAARRDPEVLVRVAACEAMFGFEDQAVLVVLEEIASSDPEQEVRYAAEKLLYERRLRAGNGAGS